MLSGKYAEFYLKTSKIVPHKNIVADHHRTVTFGTDASFYRLNPKIVINVENEREVQQVLLEANKLRLPVTFRAAGTL